MVNYPFRNHGKNIQPDPCMKGIIHHGIKIRIEIPRQQVKLSLDVSG